jgi:GTP-dependent phosphoenolpyruvate carboxykinase
VKRWSSRARPSKTCWSPDSRETKDALLAVDVAQWQQEMASVLDYLEGFGDRLPKDLLEAHEQVVEDLQKAI